jgi:hypothetical protein
VLSIVLFGLALGVTSEELPVGIVIVRVLIEELLELPDPFGVRLVPGQVNLRVIQCTIQTVQALERVV